MDDYDEEEEDDDDMEEVMDFQHVSVIYLRPSYPVKSTYFHCPSSQSSSFAASLPPLCAFSIHKSIGVVEGWVMFVASAEQKLLLVGDRKAENGLGQEKSGVGAFVRDAITVLGILMPVSDVNKPPVGQVVKLSRLSLGITYHGIFFVVTEENIDACPAVRTPQQHEVTPCFSRNDTPQQEVVFVIDRLAELMGAVIGERKAICAAEDSADRSLTKEHVIFPNTGRTPPFRIQARIRVHVHLPSRISRSESVPLQWYPRAPASGDSSSSSGPCAALAHPASERHLLRAVYQRSDQGGRGGVEKSCALLITDSSSCCMFFSFSVWDAPTLLGRMIEKSLLAYVTPECERGVIQSCYTVDQQQLAKSGYACISEVEGCCRLPVREVFGEDTTEFETIRLLSHLVNYCDFHRNRCEGQGACAFASIRNLGTKRFTPETAIQARDTWFQADANGYGRTHVGVLANIKANQEANIRSKGLQRTTRTSLPPENNC
ncbi:hypothetical protein V8E53_011583 [Lactarius tabidus]